MSIHPSLKGSKGSKHKSVLKRLEKMLRLQKEDKWKEQDSVFGLPKVKVVKLRIKKEKVAKTAEGAVAEVAAGGAEQTQKAAGAPGAKSLEDKKSQAEKKPQSEKKPEGKKK